MENTGEFFKKYVLLRTRLAPFKMKTDFETVKTVSVCDILIERAYNVNAGASVFGRYGFGPGHTVENYMSRAEAYVSALERGEYPLKGRFTEPGQALVDHSFVIRDGEAHIFYNRGYIGYEWDTMTVDTVGHAVSNDLINWRIEPPCVTVDRDLFEDYQVWSPGVAEKNGRYYMYYTGVNYNAAQAICLAESDDLYTWRKYGKNPVVKPGAWCPWDESHWSDCRDAMVFNDDGGRSYMYYCTSRYDGKGGAVPALGIAVSTDMHSWDDLGAYSFDICDHALESPFVIKRGGRYYLFFTNCGHGTSYAVSDDPVTGWQSLGTLLPYTTPPLCPANVPSCAEVFEFGGGWYISSCLREPGCEQYLELFHLFWNEDGTVSVGNRVE
jgi:predicted GH43/DUF377 family glycosyl hydrolase